MIKKFECLNCHHKFDGDDAKDVSCPKCSSDNVKPVTSSSLGMLVKGAVFLLVVAATFFCIKSFRSDVVPGPNPNPFPDTPYVPEPMPDPIPPVPNPGGFDLPKPVTLSMKRQVANKEKGTYNCSVKATHLEENKVKVKEYKLLSSDGNKVIDSSEDGHFVDIPSTPDGTYTITCMLSDNQVISQDFGGFRPIVVVDNRMKAAELTALLNSKDANLQKGKNPSVSKGAVVEFNNPEVITDQNEMSKNTIPEVIRQIKFNAWKSVEVTEVEYDSKGSIVKVHLTISKNKKL